MKLVHAIGLVALLPAVATAAIIQSDVLNVDFNVTNGSAGTYNSTAVVSGAGTKWNGVAIGNLLVTIPSFSSGTLVNSVNDSGGIASHSPTVSLTNFRPYDSGTPAPLAPALMTDIAAGVSADTPSNPSPMGFTITGLNNGTYDLYLYSNNGSFSNSGSAFTVNGVTKTATNSGQTTFVQGGNYVVYSGIVVSGGSLTGSVATTIAGNASSFNGFQLVILPEPTSAAVLFVAGGFLTVKRRRRS
jgi:hypothetical protein